MYYKIIQLSLKFLKDEEFRKQVFKIIMISIALVFFMPIFIVQALDHTYFSKDRNNNIFNTIQKNIYYKYDVVVDNDIVRAIDTVLYNGSTNQNTIEDIIKKFIIHKEVKTVKETVNVPVNYKVKEKKLVPVSHIIFNNGKPEIIKTNEEKEVEVKKTKYVQKNITKKEVVWVSRNLDETIKYMLKNNYINKEQANYIKQMYQIDKMLAPNTFSPMVGGSGYNPFNGQPMTYQPSMSQQAFINKVGTLANEVYHEQGGEVPSLTVAQAILESGWGRSGLASKYNNLFGIKAFDWGGAKVLLPTTEYTSSGVPYHIMSYFRVYPNWKDSIIDHGDFILDNSRYRNMIGVKSYVTQANDLVVDGYATDPSYAVMLINIVREYNLDRFDVGI